MGHEAVIIGKQEQAVLADSEVLSLLEWMNHASAEADGKRAKLGRLLVEVSEKELYRELGFRSFDQWLQSRISQFGQLRRTQLYAHLFTARHLLPHVDEKQFEEIGINKARVVAEAIKTTGVAPSKAIIKAATDPKVTESKLRQLVTETYNLPEKPQEEGRWHDLGQLGTMYATEVSQLRKRASQAGTHYL